jgi:hypothetical protein
MKIRKLIAAIALSTAIYSMAAWLYVVAMQIELTAKNPYKWPGPVAMPWALAHFTFWPFNMRLDTFSIVCFIISWASFTVWRLTKE